MTLENGATLSSAISCAMAFIMITIIDGDAKFALIYCGGGFVALIIRTIVFNLAVRRMRQTS